MVTRGVAGGWALGWALGWATGGLLLAASSSARADEPALPPSPAPSAPASPSTEAPAPPVVAPVPTPSASAPTPAAPAEKGAPVPEKDLRWVGTLGVLALPRLVSVDLFARIQKRWGVGLMFEYLPPGLAHFGDETTIPWLQIGAQGRYFFNDFLYAGLAFGYQYSRADSSKFGSEVDYLTESAYFAPKVGFLWTFKSGLTIGGDLGVTLPFAHTYSFKSDGTEDSNARKASRTFGEFVMPYVTLFRVGYTL